MQDERRRIVSVKAVSTDHTPVTALGDTRPIAACAGKQKVHAWQNDERENEIDQNHDGRSGRRSGGCRLVARRPSMSDFGGSKSREALARSRRFPSAATSSADFARRRQTFLSPCACATFFFPHEPPHAEGKHDERRDYGEARRR